MTLATINGLCVTSTLDRRQTLISWVGVTLADYYKVYRSLTPYSTPESLSNIYAPTVTYYDWPPLTLDSEFYYYVTQVQGLTESARQTTGVTIEPTDAFDAIPESPTFYQQTLDVFSEYFDNTDMSEKFTEIRQRTLAMLLNDGEDVYLLKRKWSGRRCPCWSKEAMQAQARCPICFGTSWVGGYYPKLLIKVRFAPAGRMVAVYEEGMRKEYEPRSWTIWTPRLRDRDVLVRKDNKRYEVLNITDVPKWRNLRTRQDFETKEVLPEDIIHAIKL